MEVQMGHGLLAGLADIGHHTVARLGKAQFPGQLGDDLKDMGHHGAVAAVHLGHGADMGLGDHQEMGGRLGRDIVEGVADVILLDLAAGDLPGHDLAEQTIRHLDTLLCFR